MSRLNTLIHKDLKSEDRFRKNCIPGNLSRAYLALNEAGTVNWCQVHNRTCSKCGMNQNNLENLIK